MKIRKMDDGTLLVPKRIEAESIEGDGIIEIKSDHQEYEKFLEQYNREKLLERNEMGERGLR